jgi:membrane associated rhomboid family serine protease
MGYILLLAVALTIAYRSTTAPERKKYLRAFLLRIDHGIWKVQGWWREIEPFRQALCARTRFAPAAPLIVLLNVAVFIGMIVHPHLLGDPDPLVSWGANFGPRTANGEWWRLVSTLFVHANGLDLVVNLLAFIPVAMMLERIVGPTAFLAVYLVAGMFASLFCLSVFPVDVTVGATGGVAGSYGFLMAALLWGVTQRPRFIAPLITIKWLGCCAGVFALYATVAGALPLVVVGFVSGLMAGVTVSRGVNTRPTPAVRMTATVATMICLAISTAVPLRGIADARRELAEIVAMEDRTAAAFRTALEDFTDGRMTGKALNAVIDQVIMPELQYAGERLSHVDRQLLPKEQQELVAAAQTYLALRDESWALRANALSSGKMSILWVADQKEVAALEALETVR